MSIMPDHFQLAFQPVAHADAVIRCGQARFTVLTDRLLRLEYHPDGQFIDRPSQEVWFREQPAPAFSAVEGDNSVEIETAHLVLRYTDRPGVGFSPETLAVELKATGATWQPGMSDAANLRGTTRTLDMINGYTPLEPGLMSRAGWAVLDDSATLLFDDDCWLQPRPPGGEDLYFFGYGQDYRACLQDYCRISGRMPLIPRWALGNWWSRYWAYTQDELVTLLEDFTRYDLPFSVCIVDMDWHVTETGNESTGWTGYTWNRELFPDPAGFLAFAHERDLRVGLNLHPAEGVHPHEDQYDAMARQMGIDPATQQPVPFAITDPVFADAYLTVLHHPHEKMGVDFWWLDWQQGLSSDLPGLDPLWLINHLHYYDLGRDGTKRPFIFSRWGRQGQQRYPIGFSGDTYATWDSLRFQPYMTATASNIAYGWWSHDIGGHTGGVHDSELLARWVQAGALSPINRLHTTKGVFYDRRPWIFEDAELLRVITDAMQFRHALLPYLYTMARRAYDDSLPLIQPMYYSHPDEEAAYHCPRQYWFGSELIAAPFVTPADEATNMSRQVVWLPAGTSDDVPDGEWVHVFSGEYYTGDRWQPVYGQLGDIPLFARAGAIVPLAGGPVGNDTANPAALNVLVFAGADNSFTLYEDDGHSTAYQDGHACRTTIRQTLSDEQLTITVAAPVGDTRLIPAERAYQLTVYGVSAGAAVTAMVNGAPVEVATTFDADRDVLVITGLTLDRASALQVTLTAAQNLLVHRDRTKETLLRLLKFFTLHTGVRNAIAANLDATMADPAILAPYLVTMTPTQGQALCELLFDAGLHVITETSAPVQLLLWNNRADPALTFRYGAAYLRYGMVRETQHERGAVARFACFTPPDDHWRHGAQEEIVQRAQWQVQVDYANVFTVAASDQEESP